MVQTSSFAENTSTIHSRSDASLTRIRANNTVPKLMYGFGDDKHVSNDTVAVMEEMLIEYIVDVVSSPTSYLT